MMYSNKFVSCLKHNGKILREDKDVVYIPFGSEFSILLKNLNNVRALVSVTIDGVDATVGKLVVNANSEVDLERYLTTDLTKGNRFKFIARSANIEKHRGVRVEDGLLRIEFAFEVQGLVWGAMPFYPDTKRYGPPVKSVLRGMSTGDPSPMYGTSANMITTQSFTAQVNNQSISTSSSVNDIGITVPGSISNQKFQTVSDFAVGKSEVMVFRLVGELGQNTVQEAVTVNVKPTCQTCGKVNKANAKFCSECGTSLQIV